MTKQAALESLLFVAGDAGLAISDMIALLDITASETKQLLLDLQEKYDADTLSGLTLVSFANRYQLVTKSAYVDVIKRYATSPFATRLSQAALETLAIIAYKQPLTRGQIEQIRGVQSSGALQKLQLRDLIEEKGRDNTPGRPILYGTTDYFMNYFAMNDLSQLPDISQFADVSETALQDLFGARYEQALQEEGDSQ